MYIYIYICIFFLAKHLASTKSFLGWFPSLANILTLLSAGRFLRWKMPLRTARMAVGSLRFSGAKRKGFRFESTWVITCICMWTQICTYRYTQICVYNIIYTHIYIYIHMFTHDIWYDIIWLCMCHCTHSNQTIIRAWVANVNMDISPSFGALKHFLGNADLVPYWNSGYFPGNIINVCFTIAFQRVYQSITIKCEIGQYRSDRYWSVATPKV